MSSLNLALEALSRGYAVFPLSVNSKIPQKGTNAYKSGTHDEATVRNWWTKTPNANVGISTGSPSGVWVLDLDSDEELPEGASVKDVLEWGLRVLNIPAYGKGQVIQTPSGGVHIWFEVPQDATVYTSTKKLYPSIDVKGDRGHAAYLGSTFKGKTYTLIGGEIGQASDELLALVLNAAAPKPRSATSDFTGWLNLTEKQTTLAQEIIETKVQNILTKLKRLPDDAAWGLHFWAAARDLTRIGRTPGTGYDLEAAQAVYLQTCEEISVSADSKHDSPTKGERYWRTASFMDDYEPVPAGALRDARPFSFDDFGNADRLLHYRNGEVLWVSDRERWLVFNEGKWTRMKWENAGEAFRQIWSSLPDVEGPLYSESIVGKESQREKFTKFYHNFSSIAKTKQALETLKTHSEVIISDEDTDRDPRYLGTQNGVIDLETYELIENEPEMLVTRSTACDYDDSAKCPTWDRIFERQIPDPVLRHWAEVAIATATVREGNPHKHFIILKSDPDTGKSKILETTKDMMGTYGSSFDFTMMKSSIDPDKPRPDLVSVHRCRVITASETDEKIELSAAMIKKLTGADSMKIRALKDNQFLDTLPSYTPIVGFNNPPAIPEADKGVRRRIVVIPFGESVPVAEQDDSIGQKLKAEWPGILAKFIRLLQDEEILKEVPAEFSMAADEMFQEVNPFQHFIDTATEPDLDAEVSNPEIFEAWNYWKVQMGIGTIVDEVELGRQLNKLGWKAGKSPKKFDGQEGKKRYRLGRRITVEIEVPESPQQIIDEKRFTGGKSLDDFLNMNGE